MDEDPNTWDFAFKDIEIYGGTIFTEQSGTKRTVIYSRNIKINGGSINATGKGYMVGQGPGSPSAKACGAGHGGKGGSYDQNPGGVSYGNATMPITAGSGANASYSHGTLGSGGGALRIIVSDRLTINDSDDYGGGSIQSNGTADTNKYAGSGAGGSIWIDADIIEGNAVKAIQAKGGNGVYKSSGGGGGRVAIYADSNTMDNRSISVSGGTYHYKRSASGKQGTLFILNDDGDSDGDDD